MAKKKDPSREQRKLAIERMILRRSALDIEALRGMLDAEEIRHRIEKLEAQIVLAKRQDAPDHFTWPARILDLLLEPDDAEDVIGNLHELYERRHGRNAQYARVWLYFQVAWVIFGRFTRLLREFRRANAGK